jgi:Ca2+-binding RTX toxin-like protein
MKRNSLVMCEQLESRRLLSASLVDGVLKVVGTRGDDHIDVTTMIGNANRIQVNFNGAMSSFAVVNVKHVVVQGRSGNDFLSVGSDDQFNHATGILPLGVFMSGGPGDDLIAGSVNNDRIFGGDGKDLIYGATGDDLIDGGAGNDEMYGMDGNDIIWGGVGDDKIYGDAGDDQLYGGDGIDYLYGDDGNDRFLGGEGRDVFYGGAGNDRWITPLRGPSDDGLVSDDPREMIDHDLK